VGLTPSPATARRLALSWGVVPVVDGGPSAPLHDLALGHCRRLGLVRPGDVVAVVAAASGEPGALPDDLRLVEVPEPFA
jgi:pyruvate kinase